MSTYNIHFLEEIRKYINIYLFSYFYLFIMFFFVVVKKSALSGAMHFMHAQKHLSIDSAQTGQRLRK